MILNYAKLQALQIDTEVFYSGETLFKTIENKDKYGLIFLDIQLLQLDGVQVGKQIRERLGNEKISIVYISSKETYAMSLFQVRPLVRNSDSSAFRNNWDCDYYNVCF